MFLVCTVHRCTASAWNVACVTELLNFKFYLVLINLNSNMWLMAVLWDSTSIACWHCLNIVMWKKMWSFSAWGMGGSRREPFGPWGKPGTNLWSTDVADLGGISWFFIWVIVYWIIPSPAVSIGLGRLFLFPKWLLGAISGHQYPQVSWSSRSMNTNIQRCLSPLSFVCSPIGSWIPPPFWYDL